MVRKLGEELGQLSSLDYAYQLSRYVIEVYQQMSLKEFKDRILRSAP